MIVKAALVLLIYLIEYYLYGFAVAKICKVKHISMISSVIVGFWLQGIVFFAFIMPFKVAMLEVSKVSKIWLIVWVFIITTIILIWHKDIRANIVETGKHIANNKALFCGIAVVILIQLLYEFLFGNYTDGNGAAYFVGAASTDLFYDRFGLFMPETGLRLAQYDKLYFLQTYVHHSTVVCKLTGLAPLVEMMTVMSSVVIILSGLIVYKLSNAIFKDDRKNALIFWMIYQILILIFANSVYIPAYYLFYRAFEGKTIFGMLLIPYVFYCYWKLYDNEKDTYTLVSLVLALLGSYTFCMSTMYVLPFLLIAYLGVAIVQRSRRQFINWCIMMMPTALSIIYYIMVLKGIIDLTINW